MTSNGVLPKRAKFEYLTNQWFYLPQTGPIFPKILTYAYMTNLNFPNVQNIAN